MNLPTVVSWIRGGCEFSWRLRILSLTWLSESHLLVFIWARNTNARITYSIKNTEKKKSVPFVERLVHRKTQSCSVVEGSRMLGPESGIMVWKILVGFPQGDSGQDRARRTENGVCSSVGDLAESSGWMCSPAGVLGKMEILRAREHHNRINLSLAVNAKFGWNGPNFRVSRPRNWRRPFGGVLGVYPCFRICCPLSRPSI